MTGVAADRAAHAGRETAAAAVLAGGRGNRIGGNKANMVLAGRTLAGRAVDSLRRAGLDPFVVTKRDRPVEIEGVEVLFEADEPQHPLAGLAAAIREAGGRRVVVLACDLPLLPVAYLGWLAGQTDGAVVPRVGTQVQPLAALYGPGDLETIEAALARQDPVKSAVARLSPTLVGDDELRRFGDPTVMFSNVNTPEDLRRAEEVLAGS
ncbi:MAG: NTP transferase domain-containing protein [Solirubrobacterales bacterium]|nr:NTP transferase domain-containing protein [Solirubrobacterales bacterium]